MNSGSVCYFEAKIDRLTPTGLVSVGLALRDNRVYNEPYSYSFTASLQQNSAGSTLRAAIAKPRIPVEWLNSAGRKADWKEGDIIGCGFDLEHEMVFFTINGEFMGMALGIQLLNWHACIGLGPGCAATINMGSQVCLCFCFCACVLVSSFPSFCL
jgi:hypothetical protein